MNRVTPKLMQVMPTNQTFVHYKAENNANVLFKFIIDLYRRKFDDGHIIQGIYSLLSFFFILYEKKLLEL